MLLQRVMPRQDATLCGVSEIERLEQAADRYRTAAAEMDAARTEVRAAVLAALDAGHTVAEVTRASPYTDREQIRRIRG